MTRRNRFQRTQMARRERAIPHSLARSPSMSCTSARDLTPWSSRNSPVPHVKANFVPYDAKVTIVALA
jgi:hypothetical protein